MSVCITATILVFTVSHSMLGLTTIVRFSTAELNDYKRQLIAMCMITLYMTVSAYIYSTYVQITCKCSGSSVVQGLILAVRTSHSSYSVLPSLQNQSYPFSYSFHSSRHTHTLSDTPTLHQTHPHSVRHTHTPSDTPILCQTHPHSVRHSPSSCQTPQASPAGNPHE